MRHAGAHYGVRRLVAAFSFKQLFKWNTVVTRSGASEIQSDDESSHSKMHVYLVVHRVQPKPLAIVDHDAARLVFGGRKQRILRILFPVNQVVGGGHGGGPKR